MSCHVVWLVPWASELCMATHRARGEGREVERREVAHGDLVRRGVLQHLGAQVRRLDGAEVLRRGWNMYGSNHEICQH